MNSKLGYTTDRWHVLYTKPRHEKKLQQFLIARGVAVYLPLYKTLKIWSDRKKKVEEPLFKSYLFVKTDEHNYFTILNAPGAVKFVHFGDELATISNHEIEMIDKLLKFPENIEIQDFKVIQGEKITIGAGPFKDVEGTLVSLKGRNRLIIQIEQLGKNLVIDVPAFYVRHGKARQLSY